ncbi:MAG TPA: non-ribosomal peptide synthetase, partial [Acidimicrobiales bacterium]|nr:non-ribosomal peptide synthetase [Acidimicrobiales bacterium]
MVPPLPVLQRTAGWLDDLSARGDHPAVLAPGGGTSYEDLDRCVVRAAESLGHTRRLVLVEGGATVEALIAYLAALRAGHVVLLAPPGLRAQRALVEAYDPDVVATAATQWAPGDRRRGTAHVLHDDLALLLSTSGSTGSPKVVRLSRDNVEANAASIADYLDLGPDDRAATTLPMQYCYGLSVINSHLHAGATVVPTDLSVVDRCFWDRFRAAGATSFAGVPHTFDLLDRVGFAAMSLPSLRYVTQAGGRLPAATVRRYAELGKRDGWQLFVMYGQTEATARMAYLPPALATSSPGAIGVPIPGGSFTVDEPDDDGVGELVYSGPNVMLGYAEGPDDLALGPVTGALRTGDLGRLTPEGLYEVVGRRSRIVKPFGLRIDLDRVERTLEEHGLGGACTGDDERLVVGVEDHEQVPAVRRLLDDHLDLPRSRVAVLHADPLPRLPSGKVDLVALRALATEPLEAVRHDGCRGVRAAFAEVLGVEPGDDDTFVDLGGDSLSYVEVSMRLEEVLGTLPPDWHITPVRDLRPAPRRRRSLATADTTAVVRAVAIVLVVATHVGPWSVPGGAHTLLAVAGYNAVRFPRCPRAILGTAARIAVPAVVWTAAVAVRSEGYGWPNVLLVNGFVGRPQDRWTYWFIEALLVILLAVAAVRAVPAVARLERSRPFAVPLVALAAGLLVRFDVVELTSTHRTSRPHEVFWLFALGWAAARASRPSERLVVTAVAAVAVAGFFGDVGRELIVLAGTLLLVWAPTVPVPRVAQRIVAPL